MRFSLRNVREVVGRTVRRFPLVVIAALVSGVSAVVMVGGPEYGWRNAMMSGVLGIPLFLVVALVAERRDVIRQPRHLGPVANLAALVLLVIYGVTQHRHLSEADLIRFAQFAVAAHLLVAVLPFAARGEIRGMWQFDLALLLRFVTAVFFTGVLFGGLSLALLAVDNLLGVDIADDAYQQLWYLLAFVFNTVYFLGGVPARIAELDACDTQPTIVRVFAQYILSPLVLVYLAILLAYLVKVLVTTEWPSGWIGYLVSGVAVAGLLSLLLLKLESERPDRRWVRIYARLFHALMVPAVAMLALAVFKRIDQYGVTEMRYLLLVLTVWLAVVVVVGCWRRHLLFKAIPATLAAVAILTAVGPWSAFSVSHRWQLARLETLLRAQSRFDGESVVPAENAVAPRDEREIGRLLFYLYDHFGADALGDRTDEALQTILDGKVAEAQGEPASGIVLAAAVAEYLNLDFAGVWRVNTRGRFTFRRQQIRPAFPVRDWDYVASFDLSFPDASTFLIEADTCRVSVDWETTNLTLARNGEPVATVSLAEMLARLRGLGMEVGGDVADSLLTATDESSPVRLQVRVASLWWSEDADGVIEAGNLVGDLLIGRRRDVPAVPGE